MESKATLSPEIAAAGSFVAIPDAFPKAHSSVRNAMKFEFTTVFSEKHRVQTLFSTDRVLVDLGAVDAANLDFSRMATDCDLIKEIVERHPEEIIKCITALQQGTSDGIQKADKIVRDIGLTEESFVKRGGGFVFLIIALVVAVAASGCATGNSNKPFKAPTTPQPKPSGSSNPK